MEQHLITDIVITPVAFRDLPLLNTVGVHETYALRAIVEIVTDSGVTGVGETYGDAPHLARLQLAARSLIGVDVFSIGVMRLRIIEALRGDTTVGGHGMSGMVTGSSTPDRVLSPFDVAALLGVDDHIAVKYWDVALLGYCFLASIAPMWLLLQPRGHLGDPTIEAVRSFDLNFANGSVRLFSAPCRPLLVFIFSTMRRMCCFTSDSRAAFGIGWVVTATWTRTGIRAGACD